MLERQSATELSRLLASRNLSAVELSQHFLDRVERVDKSIQSFLTVNPESVIKQARIAQERLDTGQAHPICGLPVAFKDNISTFGLRTTCGSKLLEGYVPEFNATVTDRISDAGGVIFGKTNLDEFAMGTSTEHSAFHPTRNPWDTSRSPGGSSGGSAACVAASMAPLSLGSDTGGSIRQPAALCGIVGFKPTYGRCSRYGLVAFGSSLDQIGPFGKTVEDAALLTSAITGHDGRDSTSLRTGPVSADFDRATLKGKRLGIPKELCGPEVNSEVREAFEEAVKRLEAEGAQVTEISLPALKLAVTTYYIIAPAEASSNLARFDGVRYGTRVDSATHIEMMERTRARGFGHEVKQRILVGTYVLSAGYYDAYYQRAQQVRALMRSQILSAFDSFDFILSPTSPVPAFKLGELRDDPIALKLLDLCTIPANMAGLPAISVPCGLANGLPVGLQIMGQPMDDEGVLEVAYATERVVDRVSLPELV